jgi:hypothetical protein
MTEFIGASCGICGSLSLAPDEASQFELIRTHMLLSHPGVSWVDATGTMHRGREEPDEPD